MTRDAQRSRVYDAEQQVRTMFDRADQRGLRTIEIHGSTVTLPVERRFASLDSVQAYVDAVCALSWVRREWPRASIPVRVRARSGTGAAHYEADSATIAVPLHVRGRAWALREMVLLHEIAHHLEPGDPDDRREPAHGGAFVERYLTLVAEIIGAEAAFVLRTTMYACGVQIG